MFKTFYEDLEVGHTETFGSKRVEKSEVLEFATNYDPQPFHLNEDFAKHSVFGGLCASGWHTAAMTMRLTVDHMIEKGVASMGSPGVDTLKWPKPVFPGDTLSVEMEILAMRESKSRPAIGLVTFETRGRNQHGEIVLIMQATLMIMRRPAAG